MTPVVGVNWCSKYPGITGPEHVSAVSWKINKVKHVVTSPRTSEVRFEVSSP